MSDYLLRASRTAPTDTSGTPFEGLDVREMIGAKENGAELTTVGQTTYPRGGRGHEAHLHPNAEETLVVVSGSGRYQVGDETFDIAEGDVVFVPRGVVHATVSSPGDDLVALWVLGGAASLETAGYVSAAEQGLL
jgi:quercetin dioxygenase-like cupin family protein